MARPGPSTRGRTRSRPAAADDVNELVLDQGAVLYQRGRDGLDSPPDLGVTGPSFPEQIKLIRASTDASGVKGLCSIACGEKSFSAA